MEDVNTAVENTTKFVELIASLSDSLIILFQEPISILVLVLALLWFFLNGKFDSAMSFFERRKNKRLEKIEQYLKSAKNEGSEVDLILTEERERYYFKLATGIFAKKSYRASLTNLESKLSRNFSWRKIKSAEKFIDIQEDGTAMLREPSNMEVFGYRYNVAVALFFLGWGFVVLFFVVFANLNDFLVALKALGFSVGLFAFAGYVGAQNWSINDARAIRKELEEENITI